MNNPIQNKQKSVTRQQWLSHEIDKLFGKVLQGKKLSSDEMIRLRDYKSELRKLNTELPIQIQKERNEKSREMKLRRRRGKYGEKRLAKKTGAERKGGVGQIDAVDSLFSYESKWVQKTPASILKLMTQAQRLSKAGTIPVGVIGNRITRQVFYIVSESDWVDLHGGKGETKQAKEARKADTERGKNSEK